MMTIKDIYQWCDNSYEKEPSARDLNLTPLQLLEWEKQNSKAIMDYKNRSLVGEKLIAAPAYLTRINIDSILAGATYPCEFIDKHYIMFPNSTYQLADLNVIYELLFDETLYETVKGIYNFCWIEFEGEIISFNYSTSEGYDSGYTYVKGKRNYFLKIKLSGIKVINKPYLSPSLLGVKSIQNQTNNPSDNSSKCFIATAAFGNQDIIEVIQLREYRDNVLRKSLLGRCFISVYCVLSPTIALVIRQSNWLRKITRMFLRKFVLPLTRLRTNHLEK